jgi:GNAT superfamily N-acetyltransferase
MERPSPADVRIRHAAPTECAALLEIERRSSRRFVDIPELIGWVDDVTPSDVVEVAFAEHLVWAAETTADPMELIGWCFASMLDDALFIEQIDVLPEHGRRGVGRALLDAVECDAERRRLAALTLTTDTYVVWNRPWYEKLGFRVVPPEQQGPGLASAVADEERRGFDLTRRVAMRRDIRR